MTQEHKERISKVLFTMIPTAKYWTEMRVLWYQLKIRNQRFSHHPDDNWSIQPKNWCQSSCSDFKLGSENLYVELNELTVQIIISYFSSKFHWPNIPIIGNYWTIIGIDSRTNITALFSTELFSHALSTYACLILGRPLSTQLHIMTLTALPLGYDWLHPLG